ncbi:hypothetical protein CPLU01_01093 [Colletotrichum plurivorum]|uniref:Uncharacterized protein n=1 Tax=Colletotrichum plurivorum TaxID=2175906 RepID=A0A8H6NQH3_9PEZI|nr:hypothetical protein CPLU01_01093 [Colletotrichum plurivorum]
MARHHRRGPDVELDPHQPHIHPYEGPVADSYGEPYPSRGRSPGPRLRNRSEPAATVAASYNDRGHDPEKPRKGRKYRKGNEYSSQAHPKPDHESHKGRYHEDDGAYPRRAQSHGFSASNLRRTANDYHDLDPYAAASRRGRDRQQAYHPPRTSETRRSRYPDYDPPPPLSDNRRSRYSDHDVEPSSSRYAGHEAGPRASDRRNSRRADYDDAAVRNASETRRPRHLKREADPHLRPRDHLLEARNRYRNGSPDRQSQPTRSNHTRGRSMPSNVAVGGSAGGGRPRAKSAVGYAALGEAAQTAFRVGSQAAYQMRNDPGPWIGEKGTRVATAALGAALVDTFVGHRAANMKGGMRHQALRQACEMGIRNLVMQPAVNSANHRSGNGSGGISHGGRRRR